MALPTIPASSPTIVNPSPASVTYGSWWLQGFQIDASNPENVRVVAALKKYATDDKENLLFSPIDPPTVIVVDQVLQKSDPKSPIFDPLIAQIAQVLLTNLTQYGQNNKLI